MAAHSDKCTHLTFFSNFSVTVQGLNIW